jgi:hypothetical protein
LPCNLRSDLEHPEERDDLEHPALLEYVREHRGELLAAALTILRAHALAGRPAAATSRLGSFEHWDEIVRGAVVFATGHDPCETRRTMADEAPERKDQLALLEAWQALPGGGYGKGGVTSKEALSLAYQGFAEAPAYEDLRDALAPMERGGKPLTVRTLGMILAGLKDRNIAGLKLVKVGEDKRSTLWRVDEVAPGGSRRPPEGASQPGESSESGESPGTQSHRTRVPASPAPAHAHARDTHVRARDCQLRLPTDSPDSPHSPPGGTPPRSERNTPPVGVPLAAWLESRARGGVLDRDELRDLALGAGWLPQPVEVALDALDLEAIRREVEDMPC